MRCVQLMFWAAPITEEHQVCKDCTFCLDLEEGFSIGRMLFGDDE